MNFRFENKCLYFMYTNIFCANNLLSKFSICHMVDWPSIFNCIWLNDIIYITFSGFTYLAWLLSSQSFTKIQCILPLNGIMSAHLSSIQVLFIILKNITLTRSKLGLYWPSSNVSLSQQAGVLIYCLYKCCTCINETPSAFTQHGKVHAKNWNNVWTDAKDRGRFSLELVVIFLLILWRRICEIFMN